MIVYGYGDGLYLSELALWRAERVPIEDHAEPFEVSEPPQWAARLNGGHLYSDLHEAIAAFDLHGENRLVIWRLASDRRSYEFVGAMETAAWRQWQDMWR